jgi:hypothetical protein
MTKLKKYTLALIVALIAGIGLMGHIKEKTSTILVSPAKTLFVPAEIDPSYQAQFLSASASLLRDAVKQMIAAGASPAKITFTGAPSADDVFGSGKIKANIASPSGLTSPGTCSPSPCHWKFLPAIQKDKGWYVYGAGTSATDIIVYLEGIDPAACRLIQMQSNPYRSQTGLTNENYVLPNR